MAVRHDDGSMTFSKDDIELLNRVIVRMGVMANRANWVKRKSNDAYQSGYADGAERIFDVIKAWWNKEITKANSALIDN